MGQVMLSLVSTYIIFELFALQPELYHAPSSLLLISQMFRLSIEG